MCYSKPGPRCAGHARAALDRAKAVSDAANELAAVVIAGSNVPTDVLTHRTKAEQAQEAYEKALREYETTPEGQVMLQQIVNRLRAENDTEAADLAEARLVEAVAARQQQLADHADAIDYGNRLENLDPSEERAVRDAERDYDIALNATIGDEILLDEAEADADRAAKALKVAQDEFDGAVSWLDAADADLDAAVASGDQDRINQAREMTIERQVEVERARTMLDEAQAHNNHLGRVAEELRTHTDVSRMFADNARLERDQTKALIGSGMGHSFHKLHLAQAYAEDMVTTNPDGTINVAKYEAPSEGFPYGRFRRAVGVEQRPDDGGAYMLKFDDGSEAWAETDYAATNLATEPDGLVVLPPDSGATRAIPVGRSFHQQLNRAG